MLVKLYLIYIPKRHHTNASASIESAIAELQRTANKVEPISSLTEVQRSVERFHEAPCSALPSASAIV